MDKFFTTKEVARLFKVKEITIRRWVNKGWFPAIKIGKMYRIKKKDLEKFVEKKEKAL